MSKQQLYYDDVQVGDALPPWSRTPPPGNWRNMLEPLGIIMRSTTIITLR